MISYPGGRKINKPASPVRDFLTDMKASFLAVGIPNSFHSVGKDFFSPHRNANLLLFFHGIQGIRQKQRE